MTLTLTPLSGIPPVQVGDDLARLISDALQQASLYLEPGDILVLAQKIVSKAEGRMVDLSTVTPSIEAQELAERTQKDPRVVELILNESVEIVRTRPGLIVVEHNLGFICANAGIDHSNVGEFADERVLLLPEFPDTSAKLISKKLEDSSGTQVGVLIIDSHGRAWRLGTVGVAIGISGLPGLIDLRGEPDMFGRKLKITEVGVADELAAAASLVMGQADEGTPVIHVRGFPYPARDASIKEMIRPKDEDLFR